MLTPIVLIAEENCKQLNNSLASCQIPVENLDDQTMQEVDSSLTTFTLRQNSRYPVFIVNPSQGRGIDFATNTEIENNGGVHVLISLLPQYFLQFRQFLGRTGRIGNKGSYSIYICDKL